MNNGKRWPFVSWFPQQNTLCEQCQRFTSEFILSDDFSDTQRNWVCYKGQHGKHYREVVIHHRSARLHYSTEPSCQLCRWMAELEFTQLCFPIAHDKTLRVSVSDTGCVELHLPPACIKESDDPCPEIRLGWEEITAGQSTPPSKLKRYKKRNLTLLANEVILPWLEHCDAGHPHSRGEQQRTEPRSSTGTEPSPSEPELPLLPTRVIDVGTSERDPRLHVSEPGQRARYLTLSYRWGNGNAPHITTALNVEKRKKSIRLAALPKTIRDAILVTRSLGIQYIWIDAICIIQRSPNDPGDFEAEGIKMAAYYGNSYCTLAATSAADAKEGFLQPRSDDLVSKSITLPPWAPRGRQVRIAWVPDWSKEVPSSSLYTRGWVFQERTLSKRTLHWGRRGLWWECEHQRASEFFPQDPIPPEAYTQPWMKLRGWLGSIRSEQDMWPAWGNLVTEYSHMDLSHESDRLIAIQGIVDVISQRFPNDKCLAGLWCSGMLQQLCWATAEPGRGDPKANGPRGPCAVPSWSWAASPYPIHYDFIVKQPLARFLGRSTDSERPNGHVLHFQGTFQRVHLDTEEQTNIAPTMEDFLEFVRRNPGTDPSMGVYCKSMYYINSGRPAQHTWNLSGTDMLLLAIGCIKECEHLYDIRKILCFLAVKEVSSPNGRRYRRIGLGYTLLGKSDAEQLPSRPHNVTVSLV
ncbi:hypothetical protein VTJ83DRAFT_7483 [Remersonia thermophila]|uniref:Heterokaryon incompatibility domain-containing protein n=1 Tax=Remersonia thermophila TaxID=72144 RepID=A0ABR4D3S5_9PEZI